MPAPRDRRTRRTTTMPASDATARKEGRPEALKLASIPDVAALGEFASRLVRQYGPGFVVAARAITVHWRDEDTRSTWPKHALSDGRAGVGARVRHARG